MNKVIRFAGHEEVAARLNDLGWKSPCDAQWTNLRDWLESLPDAAPQPAGSCSLAEVKGIVEEVRRGAEISTNESVAIAAGRYHACDEILARLSALKPNGGGDDARDAALRFARNRIESEDYIGTCGCTDNGECECLKEHNEALAKIDAALRQSTGTGVEG